MNLNFEEFIKKFNDPSIEEVELNLENQKFFIVQKQGEIINLYRGEMTEYLEDPSYKKDTEIITQLFQNNETGKIAYIHDHESNRGVKLVAHLKKIEKLVDHVDFKNVTKISYTEKK